MAPSIDRITPDTITGTVGGQTLSIEGTGLAIQNVVLVPNADLTVSETTVEVILPETSVRPLSMWPW